MVKNIVIAGILGALVMMAWTIVVNGILGFQARIDMKTLPEERIVYETLKEHVVEPGRYTCNPELTPERRFPEGEPVFTILYGGMGHEAAGSLMLVGLAIFFLAPLLAAWLLSHASDRVLHSYPRRVLFFAAIGFLLALAGDLSRFGIGGYPLQDAALLGLNHFFTWTAAGLVMAWRMKPLPSRVEDP